MTIKNVAFISRKKFSLMLFVLFVFGMCDLGQAQKEHRTKDSLVLHLAMSKTDFCAGEGIEITAKLENISDSPVTIRPQHLWRYTTQVAYIVNPAKLTTIPKSRWIVGHGFSEADEDYIVLSPNGFYNDTLRIDSSTELFYKKPGRYTLRSGYGQFRRFKKPGSKMFVGRVDSNTLTFFIKDCNGVPDPPFSESKANSDFASRSTPVPASTREVTPIAPVPNLAKLCEQIPNIKSFPGRDPAEEQDSVYEAIMKMGQDMMPCLVEQITNEATMHDPRSAPVWQNYRVGDTAVFLLVDLANDDDLLTEMLPTGYRPWHESCGSVLRAGLSCDTRGNDRQNIFHRSMIT